MNVLLTRLADDRGRPLRRAPSTRLAMAARWPVESDRRVALLVERINVASRGWALGGPVALAVILAGIIAWTMLCGSVASSLRGISPVFLVLTYVAVPVLGIGFLVFRATRAGARDVLRLTLEEGLCPSCGYNFHGIPAAGDGCVVCPECGAAWASERIKRREPFLTPETGAGTHVLRRFARLDGDRSSGLDDRGNRVALVHPGLRQELASAASEEHRARLRRARWSVFGVGIVARAAATVLFVLVAAMVGYVAFHVPGLSLWIRLGITAIAAAFPVAILLGNFGYNPAGVRAAMLKHGLCPCCGSDVHGREVESDGRVTCATCWAAWKLAGQTRGRVSEGEGQMGQGGSTGP